MQTTNDAGFNLTELMIVVAVVGLLASIAVPMYTRHQAKSRQAEAKLALASIYSLEKAFYSEYGAYVPSFTAIGYEPAGTRRFYRIGWYANLYANNITGYSGAYTVSYIDWLNPPASWFTCNFAATPFPGGSDPPFDTDDPQTFIAPAIGNIKNAPNNANCDWWTINELKRLVNVQVGY